jgi:hypothetical protein
VKLTLQVISRTELFNEKPIYELTVQMRGSHPTARFNGAHSMTVTREEVDAMPPGHVFVGVLSLFQVQR